MPSITPWTVIGPTRQTVESTLKAPLQGRSRYQKKTLTSQCQAQRLESRATYIKLPTLPAQGTKKHIDTLKQYRLPFYCFISFYNILSRSDFGIGGAVAGITSVTIVTEAVSSTSQASRRGFGSIWSRSIQLSKLRFINIYTHTIVILDKCSQCCVILLYHYHVGTSHGMVKYFLCSNIMYCCLFFLFLKFFFNFYFLCH